jgi:hypothetical protein
MVHMAWHSTMSRQPCVLLSNDSSEVRLYVRYLERASSCAACCKKLCVVASE